MHLATLTYALIAVEFYDNMQLTVTCSLYVCMQVPLYAINQHLVVDKLHALDVGGSITIHAFGAYYGLAASLVLSIPGSGADHYKNGASYSSDMTAMIGTIFLWLFWVSHHGSHASV